MALPDDNHYILLEIGKFLLTDPKPIKRLLP